MADDVRNRVFFHKLFLIFCDILDGVLSHIELQKRKFQTCWRELLSLSPKTGCPDWTSIRVVANATNEWCRSGADRCRDDLIKKDVFCWDLSLSRGMAVGKLSERKGNNLRWPFFGMKATHFFTAVLQLLRYSGRYVAWALWGLHTDWNTSYCWNRYLWNSVLFHSVFDHHFNFTVVLTVCCHLKTLPKKWQ